MWELLRIRTLEGRLDCTRPAVPEAVRKSTFDQDRAKRRAARRGGRPPPTAAPQSRGIRGVRASAGGSRAGAAATAAHAASAASASASALVVETRDEDVFGEYDQEDGDAHAAVESYFNRTLVTHLHPPPLDTQCMIPAGVHAPVQQESHELPPAVYSCRDQDTKPLVPTCDTCRRPCHDSAQLPRAGDRQ